MSKSAIVLGATGLVGGAVVQKLLADPAYSEIHLILRRPWTGAQSARLYPHVVDFTKPSDALKNIRAQELFCALGTTLKAAGSQEAFRAVDYTAIVEFARAALACGVERAFVVSSLGADPRSSVFYSRVKGETEEALAKLGFRELRLFRPSLLLGPRREFRMGEWIAQKTSSAMPFLFQGPLAKYRPIQADTVAEAMCEVAVGNEAGQDHAALRIYESNEIEKLALLSGAKL